MSIIMYFFLLPTISAAFLLSFPIIIKITQDKNFPYFFIGMISYILTHNFSTLDNIINKLYITSHELSHALAGLLKGNKIKKIKISNNSGYVSFSKKPDKFTTIFPYIFPFYNIVILIIHLLTLIATKKGFYPYFIFLEGFFLMFYIINTASIILTPQNDFKKFGGRIKSIFFILTMNVCIVLITISIIFPEKKFLIELLKNIVENYILILREIFKYTLNLSKLILNYVFKVI